MKAPVKRRQQRDLDTATETAAFTGNESSGWYEFRARKTHVQAIGREIHPTARDIYTLPAF